MAYLYFFIYNILGPRIEDVQLKGKAFDHPVLTTYNICGSKVFSLYLGRLFGFLILFRVGKTPWKGDQLRTPRTTQTKNRNTLRATLRVEIQPTFLAFERAKTVYALGERPL
jgi:hypothetical protein